MWFRMVTLGGRGVGVMLGVRVIVGVRDGVKVMLGVSVTVKVKVGVKVTVEVKVGVGLEVALGTVVSDGTMGWTTSTVCVAGSAGAGPQQARTKQR